MKQILHQPSWQSPTPSDPTLVMSFHPCQARIQDFLQGGGGVNDGRVQRAPNPTGGLGLLNIRLRYIASIEYSERFFFCFFAIVKKFVEKKIGRREQGGHDPPPPPGSAPACLPLTTNQSKILYSLRPRGGGGGVNELFFLLGLGSRLIYCTPLRGGSSTSVSKANQMSISTRIQSFIHQGGRSTTAPHQN